MSLNPLQPAILSAKVEAARSAARADPTLLDSRTEVNTPIVALARGTGSRRMLIAVLRVVDERPDSVVARRLLNEDMSEISEAVMCAGWLQDLELVLWQLLDDPTVSKAPFDFRSLNAEDRADLRWLSELAGGWWHFDDDADHERFVETAEWLPIYAAWVSRTTS